MDANQTKKCDCFCEFCGAKLTGIRNAEAFIQWTHRIQRNVVRCTRHRRTSKRHHSYRTFDPRTGLPVTDLVTEDRLLYHLNQAHARWNKSGIVQLIDTESDLFSEEATAFMTCLEELMTAYGKWAFQNGVA